MLGWGRWGFESVVVGSVTDGIVSVSGGYQAARRGYGRERRSWECDVLTAYQPINVSGRRRNGSQYGLAVAEEDLRERQERKTVCWLCRIGRRRTLCQNDP